MPGYHGVVAEDLAHSLGERLATVEDEQHAVSAVKPRTLSEATKPRTTEAFSVEPSTTPKGTLVPFAVTPRAPTMA
jgi:hypothetical protein